MNYFYVYILHCSDGSYYTGHTDNIEKRIAEHKVGKGGGYTSQRLPVQLVFFQPTETRERAFELERKIKKWNKGKKFALIQGNFKLVSYFGKKNF